MTDKTNIHFVDKYLANPGNPIIVNLIGAGATGCRVFSALDDINESLLAHQHPGLFVRLFDYDVINDANMGKQKFSRSEIGMNKAVALVNRMNRFKGYNWKAMPLEFCKKNLHKIGDHKYANITISSVDTPGARFEIADILKQCDAREHSRSRPMYWIDFGNSRYTGQVVVSTINNIPQPKSEKFNPVAKLPMITDEFKTLLEKGDRIDTPSCSVREALQKQDLFINLTLTGFGIDLLWRMFSEGLIYNRGLFLNLREVKTQPIPV